MEMPVWPELYEEYSLFLQENNLLWGVFSKERRDNESSFSCKFLSEVRTISQATIDQSYAAYEKAKSQLSSSRYSATNKPKKPAEKATPKAPPITNIRLDLASFRASHTLLVSSLLSSTRGTDRVHLTFVKGGQEISTLQLPPVCFTADLQKAIEQLPCWIATESP